MSATKTRAKSDGLRLLRAIDSAQAHGQGGGQDGPQQGRPRRRAAGGRRRLGWLPPSIGYLRQESALVGDEHTATQTGDRQAHGYAPCMIIAIEHERHQRAARAVPRAAKAHRVRFRPTEVCDLAFCHDYRRVEADETRGDFEEVDAAPGRRACSRSWRVTRGTSPIRTTPRRRS